MCVSARKEKIKGVTISQQSITSPSIAMANKQYLKGKKSYLTHVIRLRKLAKPFVRTKVILLLRQK